MHNEECDPTDGLFSCVVEVVIRLQWRLAFDGDVHMNVCSLVCRINHIPFASECDVGST